MTIESAAFWSASVIRLEVMKGSMIVFRGQLSEQLTRNTSRVGQISLVSCHLRFRSLRGIVSGTQA